MGELESEQVTQIFRNFEANCADTYTVLQVSPLDL
jgi:hypothetical protein